MRHAGNVGQRVCLLIYAGPLLCGFGGIDYVWLVDSEQADGECDIVQETIQERFAI